MKKNPQNEKHLKDLLTDLYNKNYYVKNMNKIATTMINDLQQNKPWSILFCDIDGLKLANETIGHVAADQGIKHLGKIINSSIRTNRKTKDQIIYPNKSGKFDDNIPIRFGGDEFIIILPNCDINEAYHIEKRIKQKVIDHITKTKNLTLSIGASTTTEIEQIPDINNKQAISDFINKLVTTAEKRMYQDKNKNIADLSQTEKEIFIMKHINRVFTDIGLKYDDQDQIDLAIKLLETIKKDK